MVDTRDAPERVQTTIRLPGVLHAAASDYCAANGATMNRLVAIALREHLATEGVEQPAPPLVAGQLSFPDGE